MIIKNLSGKAESAKHIEDMRKVIEFTNYLKLKQIEGLNIHVNLLINIAAQIKMEPERFMKMLSGVGVQYMARFEEIMSEIHGRENADQD